MFISELSHSISRAHFSFKSFGEFDCPLVCSRLLTPSTAAKINTPQANPTPAARAAAAYFGSNSSLINYFIDYLNRCYTNNDNKTNTD